MEHCVRNNDSLMEDKQSRTGISRHFFDISEVWFISSNSMPFSTQNLYGGWETTGKHAESLFRTSQGLPPLISEKQVECTHLDAFCRFSINFITWWKRRSVFCVQAHNRKLHNHFITEYVSKDDQSLDSSTCENARLRKGDKRSDTAQGNDNPGFVCSSTWLKRRRNKHSCSHLFTTRLCSVSASCLSSCPSADLALWLQRAADHQSLGKLNTFPYFKTRSFKRKIL